MQVGVEKQGILSGATILGKNQVEFNFINRDTPWQIYFIINISNKQVFVNFIFYHSSPHEEYFSCDTVLFGHWVFGTTWTVAHLAPLSVRFLRQEYWSGLPFPSPGDLPDPRIKPKYPVFIGGFFTAEPPEKPTVKQLPAVFCRFRALNWGVWTVLMYFIYWATKKIGILSIEEHLFLVNVHIKGKIWLISSSCCKGIVQSIIDKVCPQSSYFMHMNTHRCVCVYVCVLLNRLDLKKKSLIVDFPIFFSDERKYSPKCDQN